MGRQVTKRTQWQNPFGLPDLGTGGDGLYDSWHLYERFGFRGLFDHLFGLVHKRHLPRTGEALWGCTCVPCYPPPTPPTPPPPTALLFMCASTPTHAHCVAMCCWMLCALSTLAGFESSAAAS
jgi:hypothetical protein